MSPTRRSALEAALAAAVAAATPQSLFALQGRAATNANERFLVVALKDGRRLAVDRLEGKQAYLLTSTAASDGEYALSKAGSLVVQNGSVRDVREKAESAEYSFVRSAGAIEVRNRKGLTVSRVPVAREPQP